MPAPWPALAGAVHGAYWRPDGLLHCDRRAADALRDGHRGAGRHAAITGARITFSADGAVVDRVSSDPVQGSFGLILTEGVYDVTVEKDGFLRATMEGLEVGRDIALEVLLLAGDLNGDGVIDVIDLMVPAKNQGKTESPAVIKNAAECVGPGAITGNETREYPEQPPMVIQVENRYVTKMTTSKGVIVLELLPKETPVTVNNFVFLSRDGFYNGLIFHRVIEDFMIQGGDPTGTRAGGPGYSFEDEIVPSLVFDRPGLLAIANVGPDTNGSQFFITVVPTPHLNGAHTIFGRVLQGQHVADAISEVPTGSRSKPIEDIIIECIEIEETTPGAQVIDVAQ